MSIDTAPVGSLVRFAEERNPYRIRARDKRWIICTKWFAPHKTVLYTIIDLQTQRRGVHNLIFGPGFETDQECADALRLLMDGGMELSGRQNRTVPLAIMSVKTAVSR